MLDGQVLMQLLCLPVFRTFSATLGGHNAVYLAADWMPGCRFAGLTVQHLLVCRILITRLLFVS